MLENILEILAIHVYEYVLFENEDELQSLTLNGYVNRANFEKIPFTKWKNVNCCIYTIHKGYFVVDCRNIYLASFHVP